jgi:hypothetical protein
MGVVIVDEAGTAKLERSATPKGVSIDDTLWVASAAHSAGPHLTNGARLLLTQSGSRSTMSAFGGKADIRSSSLDVCF